jgi:hypothetical protein
MDLGLEIFLKDTPVASMLYWARPMVNVREFCCREMTSMNHTSPIFGTSMNAYRPLD